MSSSADTYDAFVLHAARRAAYSRDANASRAYLTGATVNVLLPSSGRSKAPKIFWPSAAFTAVVAWTHSGNTAHATRNDTLALAT